MLSIFERCPLVRGSTTCIHSTYCLKFVSFIEGVISKEYPLRQGPSYMKCLSGNTLVVFVHSSNPFNILFCLDLRRVTLCQDIYSSNSYPNLCIMCHVGDIFVSVCIPNAGCYDKFSVVPEPSPVCVTLQMDSVYWRGDGRKMSASTP